MEFIRNPNGHISNLLTFHDGFIIDYEAYVYSTWFPRPKKDTVERICREIIDSDILSNNFGNHYVIHQNNGSWIGNEFSEFREQIDNQEKRYEETDYSIDKYKNECACFIGLLNTEDYLVLNIDPWSFKEGYREFEIALLMDGLSFNDDRLKQFLEKADLSFGAGQKWVPNRGKFSGLSVAGMKVEVVDYFDENITQNNTAVCENPLYNKNELIERIFKSGGHIIGDYKYVIADCSGVDTKSPTASVEYIEMVDYSKLTRNTGHNLSLTISPGV